MIDYTVESVPAFQIIAVCRAFSSRDCQRKIPEFWDEYYRLGCGNIACGQFGYCFDEQPDGRFQYAIGNRCVRGEDGSYHIFNCPSRASIPESFTLLTVPEQTWMKVGCIGPLPQSIQGTYARIQREWPPQLFRTGNCVLEEYGYCESPEDAQKDDYRCLIWIPVQRIQ